MQEKTNLPFIVFDIPSPKALTLLVIISSFRKSLQCVYIKVTVYKSETVHITLI